jgi:hypothetical protein
MRMTFRAAILAGALLAGLQGSALAQATSAFPQTYNFADDAAQWYYVTPLSPRLFNQAPEQSLSTVRSHHRARKTEHALGAK